jgi:hypothetical protein
MEKEAALVELIEAAIDMVKPGSAVHELLTNGLKEFEPNCVQYTAEELRVFAADINRRAAEDLRRRRS